MAAAIICGAFGLRACLWAQFVGQPSLCASKLTITAKATKDKVMPYCVACGRLHCRFPTRRLLFFGHVIIIPADSGYCYYSMLEKDWECRHCWVISPE